MKNLKKYQKDLQSLIKKGDLLGYSLSYDCYWEEFVTQMKKQLKWEKLKMFLDQLPSFNKDYQSWYSESQILVKQLLPNRLDDFISFYKKPKNRKEISYENYVIEDGLQWLQSMYLWEIKADKKSCIKKFIQQLNIIKAIQSKFESSLFDIHQLLQADLLDSEIEVAEELNKKWFFRAAWAVAGVVLESHLQQVINNHNLIISKKNPTLNDLSETLKLNNVIDTPEWRKLQYLTDLRNLCDHKKDNEPTKEDIEELIRWVSKTIKNLF